MPRERKCYVACCILGNEIPISEKLIDALKIKDTIITADALLYQKDVVKKIAKYNGYILALKGNHPLMEQEVKDFFLKSGNLDSYCLYDL